VPTSTLKIACAKVGCNEHDAAIMHTWGNLLGVTKITLPSGWKFYPFSLENNPVARELGPQELVFVCPQHTDEVDDVITI
jgi:hypothetical protein